MLQVIETSIFPSFRVIIAKSSGIFFVKIYFIKSDKNRRKFSSHYKYITCLKWGRARGGVQNVVCSVHWHKDMLWITQVCCSLPAVKLTQRMKCKQRRIWSPSNDFMVLWSFLFSNDFEKSEFSFRAKAETYVTTSNKQHGILMSNSVSWP